MQIQFIEYIRKQIPILVVLSIFPGLGYIGLGWLAGVYWPALIWYGLIVSISFWGMYLYRKFSGENMGQRELQRWYRQVVVFVYLFCALWALIFVIYVQESASNLHYIAIFTQIGATTVAAAFLYPVPRLFKPIVPVMMAFLVVYFMLIGEWYGYVLGIFASILGWVLYFAANGSYELLNTIQRQASHDLLTDLRNRQHFIQKMHQVMIDLRESGGYAYLLLIDLDHFKTVNDSLGHGVGDALLQQVAQRLQKMTQDAQCVARLGGDEFIVIGKEYEHSDECRRQAERQAKALLQELKRNYTVVEHQIYISASIGIRLFSADDQDSTSLVREADIAMYEAKSSGRDGVFLFSETVSRRVEQQLEIERRLHFALNNRELYLVYQPLMDAQGKIRAVECLARWKNQDLGDIPPQTFIAIAEQTGIIIALGEYILVQALQTLRRWENRGIHLQQMAVNVSTRQLMQPGFSQRVRELCAEHLEPDWVKKLVFEITETVISDEVQRVVNAMTNLQELGISFSMDDFGTGYSSLGYLKQLPVKELKIDRSFVRNVCEDIENQAMVGTIYNIADFLGLSVVAEGIETLAEYDFMKALGCQRFQGYYLSRPLPLRDFEGYYKKLMQETE